MFSGDTTMLYDYLDGILNTVQFKDAAVRLGISNIAALETATRYLFDSVDNLVNPKSIADVMTSMGTKISSLTIFNYLKGLAAAFILYPVRHYDINYEETYSGTFTVELDDDSTEQDAINELLNNADEYRLGEQVELSDSDAEVTNVTTVKEA